VSLSLTSFTTQKKKEKGGLERALHESKNPIYAKIPIATSLGPNLLHACRRLSSKAQKIIKNVEKNGT
jgi:hypothetical protein